MPHAALLNVIKTALHGHTAALVKVCRSVVTQQACGLEQELLLSLGDRVQIELKHDPYIMECAAHRCYTRLVHTALAIHGFASSKHRRC